MQSSSSNSNSATDERDEELERKLSKLIYKTSNQQYGALKSDGNNVYKLVEVERGHGINGKFTDVIHLIILASTLFGYV